MFDNFVYKAIDVANLPTIPQDTILGKVGFYAEELFLFLAVLLLINILVKIPRREEFFTGWTTFLLVMLPISFIIFIIAWLVPEKVSDFWTNVTPQL